jgi:uncharacterized protein YndB with AHSA1/START domain
MTVLEIKNTIDINSSREKVWDALVNPQKTKIYMFGCETVSDWKAGSELLWKGSYEEKEMVFVKGYILSIDPTNKLVYSTFDPNSTMEDIPENYLTVTYELIENSEITTLNVTQGDYSKVSEGERRYKEGLNNGEGWNPILKEIKKLVESNN